MNNVLKLNLGAGNKPLPKSEGWVNIDLFPPEGALEDDRFDYIVNDVMDLQDIEDNSVDEILASHLIEHIHPKEVHNLLRHWRSKLKDGGMIRLEQPDIVKCCINFLQYVTSEKESLYLNNGLWGIYGNSEKQGDMMGHQWGYHPVSLGQILQSSGFKNIQEVDPIVKVWGVGIRDFALTAIK
jgi:hypothetical protein